MTGFDYRMVAPRKGAHPFRAFVYIIPKTYWSDDDGCPLLSPQITESEIDGWIEAFKDDLDKMGKRAKRALQRANKKTLQALSDESV